MFSSCGTEKSTFKHTVQYQKENYVQNLSHLDMTPLKMTYFFMAIGEQNSLGGRKKSARMFKTRYFQIYRCVFKKKNDLH